LYRHNATVNNKEIVKDISQLGRDLSKIAIVDNIESNFSMQKENGILIKSFYGYDPDDRSLIELKDILINIAKSDEDDIRIAIKKKLDKINKYVS